jgi:phage recombination protein Bet
MFIVACIIINQKFTKEKTMSKELQVINFNDEQTNLIKTQIAKDCTNSELELFLYQCKQTGLNPLTRQIYAIKRSGRMTIQTSIDGFRVIAERSGSYAGQDEPIWEDDEKGFPIKCTVKVYKFTPNFEQRYCAGVGVAHFKEYYPSPMLLQKSMPHTMIAKVAEALALRKAFPQDLSGLYTGDEMAQSEPQEPVDKTPKNQFSDLAEVADEDMKATQRAANEADAEMIKGLFNASKSKDDLADVVEYNKTKINKLAKYAPDLFKELKELKDSLTKAFDKMVEMDEASNV